MAIEIMLDLETMGNGPDAAIVAIGACRMDFKTFEIGETFYSRVNLASSVAAGGTMTPSTILWWMTQPQEARNEVTAPRSKPLRDALNEFSQWVDSIRSQNDRDPANVWGNGVGFDNVILRNAYASIKEVPHWDYNGDRCYRTIKSLYPNIPMQERTGVQHNALDDAINQAKHLCTIFSFLDRNTKVIEYV